MNNATCSECGSDLLRTTEWWCPACVPSRQQLQAEVERLKKEKLYEEARHGQTGIAFSLYREETLAEVERLRETIESLWAIYTNEDKTTNASDVFRRAGHPAPPTGGEDES